MPSASVVLLQFKFKLKNNDVMTEKVPKTFFENPNFKVRAGTNGLINSV